MSNLMISSFIILVTYFCTCSCKHAKSSYVDMSKSELGELVDKTKEELEKIKTELGDTKAKLEEAQNQKILLLQYVEFPDANVKIKEKLLRVKKLEAKKIRNGELTEAEKKVVTDLENYCFNVLLND